LSSKNQKHKEIQKRYQKAFLIKIFERNVMSIEKDKVNAILREFQDILKKHRPNTSELELINSKISQMTARNIEKKFAATTSSSRRKPPPSKPEKKKWHKIKID
jgi:CRISPR/Cas system-associated protein Cas10 (large subunit of type III CRISPR-Cas system)